MSGKEAGDHYLVYARIEGAFSGRSGQSELAYSKHPLKDDDFESDEASSASIDNQLYAYCPSKSLARHKILHIHI